MEREKKEEEKFCSYETNTFPFQSWAGTCLRMCHHPWNVSEESWRSSHSCCFWLAEYFNPHTLFSQSSPSQCGCSAPLFSSIDLGTRVLPSCYCGAGREERGNTDLSLSFRITASYQVSANLPNSTRRLQNHLLRLRVCRRNSGFQRVKLSSAME